MNLTNPPPPVVPSTPIRLNLNLVSPTPRSVVVVDGVAIVTLNVPIPFPPIPLINIGWPPKIPFVDIPGLPPALEKMAQFLEEVIAVLAKLVNMIPFIDVKLIVQVNGVTVFEETLMGLAMCLPTFKALQDQIQATNKKP